MGGIGARGNSPCKRICHTNAMLAPSPPEAAMASPRRARPFSSGRWISIPLPAEKKNNHCLLALRSIISRTTAKGAALMIRVSFCRSDTETGFLKNRACCSFAMVQTSLQRQGVPLDVLSGQNIGQGSVIGRPISGYRSREAFRQCCRKVCANTL